ncbi:MAG: hypothetical protein HY878_03785 [Deltaproteobacteria bacterium]|nr:hypothetical protein [Deltaproteobacteria bacterium]
MLKWCIMGINEDIDILDSKINRLKIEYEQYFAKLLKREPTKLRDEIEKFILRYSNQPIHNTALRFKYNTLVARYVSYKQYWSRILRQMEEGVYERGLVVKTSQEAKQVIQTTASDGGLKDIYQKYIEARRQCNESTANISYDGFVHTLIREAEKVKKTYRRRDIDYKVTIKDGKAKVIIVPI